MTIAVGWIHRGSVFLVADSIVSGRPGAIQDDVGDTPVGEEHPENGTTAESAVNVFQLGPRCVGTFAGLVYEGSEFLEAIRNRCMCGESARDALSRIELQSAGVVALIAEVSAVGAASIYRATNNGIHELYEDGQVAIAGSAEPGHETFVRKLIKEQIDDPLISWDADHLLATVMVVMQVQGARVNSLARGIGGAFFGMRADARGVVRQPDIGHLLLRLEALPRIEAGRWIMTGFRSAYSFSDVMLPAPASDGIQRRVRFRARNIEPVNHDELDEVMRTHLQTEHVPRYVACVDPRTTGTILLEQNEYTSRGFGRFQVQPSGLSAGLGPDLQTLVATLPSPEETWASGTFPMHFVAAESDRDRLQRNGWFG